MLNKKLTTLFIIGLIVGLLTISGCANNINNGETNNQDAATEDNLEQEAGDIEDDLGSDNSDDLDDVENDLDDIDSLDY